MYNNLVNTINRNTFRSFFMLAIDVPSAIKATVSSNPGGVIFVLLANNQKRSHHVTPQVPSSSSTSLHWGTSSFFMSTSDFVFQKKIQSIYNSLILKPWFCIIKMNGCELVNVCSTPKALTSTYSFRLSAYSWLRSCHVRADWCKRWDSFSVAVQLGSCSVCHIEAIWKHASTSM